MSPAWISSSDLARVARRHDDIEQPGLDALEDDPAAFAEATKPASSSSTTRGEETKPRPLKPAFYAVCPFHTPGLKVRNTAVLHQGDAFVFREHEKWVGGHRVRCPGSGTEWSEEACGPREART